MDANQRHVKYKNNRGLEIDSKNRKQQVDKEDHISTGISSKLMDEPIL